MTPEALLHLYQALKGLDLPEMRLARLGMTANRLSEPGKVIDALSAFAPIAGWACLQSRVVHWPDRDAAAAPDPSTETPDMRELLRDQGQGAGLLLSAEAVDGDDNSLHIRQDGRGGWRVTYFNAGESDTYLEDDVELIRHRNAPQARRQPGRLCYRRYWAVEPDSAHGVRQLAARFVGFTADQSKNGETV